MKMTINDLLLEFMLRVDEIYGVYLDATNAFKLSKFKFEEIQKESSEKHKLSIDYLDTLPNYYGIGDPNDPDSIILHECTQKEFKERNERGGKNYSTIAQLCVTQLYQYWEDYYRLAMAESLEIEKKNLIVDIFGDLRLFRHSILHHQAVALPDIEKCKMLKWFKEGDAINLTEDQIQTIIYHVKVGLNEIPEKYSN